MSLPFNMMSRLVIALLPRCKNFLNPWLQSPSAVILEPPKIKSLTVSMFKLNVYKYKLEEEELSKTSNCRGKRVEESFKNSFLNLYTFYSLWISPNATSFYQSFLFDSGATGALMIPSKTFPIVFFKTFCIFLIFLIAILLNYENPSPEPSLLKSKCTVISTWNFFRLLKTVAPRKHEPG